METTAEKKKIIVQWGQIVLGLLVFAFGVHLTIFANIGLAPWDCLAMGLSRHIPLNYGLSVTLISVIVLIVDLLMRERIGYGTIIDALLTGNFTQLFNQFNPFQENQNLYPLIQQIIKSSLNTVSADFSAQSHFGKIWQKNILANLNTYSTIKPQQKKLPADYKTKSPNGKS